MSREGIEPQDVLWKATALEEFFALSHDNFCNLTCYCLTIHSKSALQYAHVYEAMQHLYRLVDKPCSRCNTPIIQDNAASLEVSK